LKIFFSALITAALFVDCVGLNLEPHTNHQQLNDVDSKAAQQLAIEFSIDFVRTADLAPLLKKHFVPDFIQRYTKGKLAADANSPHMYFVPGLEYNSRLLPEASPEDWLKFYAAANNFFFFGTMSGMKKYHEGANIDPTDMYPPIVINLLNTNPNLSNMIVRKGPSKPVDSVAAMQKATATLEQAVSLMRQQTKGQNPFKVNEQELIKVIQEDDVFRPKVQTVDNQFFGLPQGTQVVLIATPILFQLVLVKDNDKWKILWAEPYIGG
jgi:hypothetical protein